MAVLNLLLDHIDDLNTRFALQKQLAEENFSELVAEMRKVDNSDLQEKLDTFDALVSEDVEAVMRAGPNRKATLVSGDKLT